MSSRKAGGHIRFIRYYKMRINSILQKPLGALFLSRSSGFHVLTMRAYASRLADWWVGSFAEAHHKCVLLALHGYDDGDGSGSGNGNGSSDDGDDEGSSGSSSGNASDNGG